RGPLEQRWYSAGSDQFWRTVGEGGVIVNSEAADYLFSSNASHPDTKRIHQSLDYLEDRITVFHPCFLTASINAETKNTVALGHFILLPASLQKGSTQGSSERGKLTYVPLQDYPSSNMVTGYTSEKVLKKFLGEIRDFIPGYSGYFAYWIPNETNVFSDVKMKLKRKS
uniref:Telomere repeat binding bouquet formation protein 2 n=1 Tax=Laticauda laticaudata TaxID=8630 RepID=A0A8C5SKP8_LATLA